MSKVLSIGPTYISEVLSYKGLFVASKSYPAQIRRHMTGGSYTIAYNLAVLGLDSYLITRLGFDAEANDLFLNFDGVNGMLYSNSCNLLTTPSKIYIHDMDEKITTFSSLTFDVYPSIEDGLPEEYFTNVQFGLIDIINTNYLDRVLHSHAEIRWICTNTIPADAYLPYIEGIILDYDYAATITISSKFKTLAGDLFSKGIKWLAIVNNGKQVRFFSSSETFIFPEKEERAGSKREGTFEAFISMFIACLSEGMSFTEAVERGHKLANSLSFIDPIVLSNDLFEQ